MGGSGRGCMRDVHRGGCSSCCVGFKGEFIVLFKKRKSWEVGESLLKLLRATVGHTPHPNNPWHFKTLEQPACHLPWVYRHSAAWGCRPLHHPLSNQISMSSFGCSLWEGVHWDPVRSLTNKILPTIQDPCQGPSPLSRPLLQPRSFTSELPPHPVCLPHAHCYKLNCVPLSPPKKFIYCSPNSQ